jgi:hypothetical protein
MDSHLACQETSPTLCETTGDCFWQRARSAGPSQTGATHEMLALKAMNLWTHSDHFCSTISISHPSSSFGYSTSPSSISNRGSAGDYAHRYGAADGLASAGMRPPLHSGRIILASGSPCQELSRYGPHVTHPTAGVEAV